MDKVGAAPTQDVAVHLEMFATIHPLELAQGTTRVVPYRELAPNNNTSVIPTYLNRSVSLPRIKYKPKSKVVLWSFQKFLFMFYKNYIYTKI